MGENGLTADELRAIESLLPPERRTGEPYADLIEAARESHRRRVENSRLGGIVLGGLHNRVRSWRAVGEMVGIPFTTARAWSKRADGAVDTESAESPAG